MPRSPLSVIVRFDEVAAQWVATFDGSTCVDYRGDYSTEAARRLLDGTGEPSGDLELQVERIGGGISTWVARLEPPDLLLRCPKCEGKGEYVGLVE